MEEKGLYRKFDNYSLAFAANWVKYPKGIADIKVSDYENHVGEVKDGWYWFNTQAEAKAFFNIQEPPIVDNPFDLEIQQ